MRRFKKNIYSYEFGIHSWVKPWIYWKYQLKLIATHNCKKKIFLFLKRCYAYRKKRMKIDWNEFRHDSIPQVTRDQKYFFCFFFANMMKLRLGLRRELNGLEWFFLGDLIFNYIFKNRLSYKIPQSKELWKFALWHGRKMKNKIY